MKKSHFVVITCDASNRKATKLLAILVWHCEVDNDIRLKTSILKIHSLTDETSETVSSVLVSTEGQYCLENKVVGLIADNAPVNFGSINRKTTGNVHSQLEHKFGKKYLANWMWCPYFA